MAVTSTHKGDNKDTQIHKQDKVEMVVTSPADQKGKISNKEIKEDEIGKTSQQPDPLKMAVTPTTNRKGKIANGDKTEKKIGKTCHQCRQVITGLSACCNNQKKDRTCPSKYCQKCLWNRYGEEAEEKSVLNDWNCPKCRGICNCSVCMKRRGHQPTGQLVHTAKATGFSSVSEMLRIEGPKPLVHNKRPKIAVEGSENNDASNNESSGGFPTKSEKENSTDNDLNFNPVPSIPTEKQKKRKRAELKNFEEISLPRGTELTTLAGMDLLAEDVGEALQFLEFSTAFKEVLDLKEGEPEYILQELLHGGSGCRGKHSPVIRFHIVLLSLIQKDFNNESPVLTYKSGKKSWLHALRNCTSRSKDVGEKLKLDDFTFEADEYESLSSSTRLRLLNFLCDEVLCTVKLRSWIDDQNFKFAENVKLSKERIQAAKQKENQLKLKLQDEVAKAVVANNVVQVSASEHEAVVSNLKTEVAQAHAEMLAAKDMVPYEIQNCVAARTEPLISDSKGRIYWRLKGYSDDSNLFLQDVGSWDGAVCSEKWFTLDDEQLKEVDDVILSRRKRKATSQQLIFT